MQQYTSMSVRERMLALYRQGVKPLEIAKQVGKSPMTVYRLIERLHSHPKKVDRLS